MKTINTKRVLKSFKGDDLKADDENIVFGTVLSNILGGRTTNPSLAWVLGKMFATEKTVDLKAEEVVYLKQTIEDAVKVSPENGGWLTSLIAGQLIEILEEKETEKK